MYDEANFRMKIQEVVNRYNPYKIWVNLLGTSVFFNLHYEGERVCTIELNLMDIWNIHILEREVDDICKRMINILNEFVVKEFKESIDKLLLLKRSEDRLKFMQHIMREIGKYEGCGQVFASEYDKQCEKLTMQDGNEFKE